MVEAVHIILYVADQARSTTFYETVLAMAPQLHVPGMTEFRLPGGTILGLMPESGIERLLGPSIIRPSTARGVARAELYLRVQDPNAWHARALAAGARELSPMQLRSWGDGVAYSQDPDGHVLAFAGGTSNTELAA